MQTRNMTNEQLLNHYERLFKNLLYSYSAKDEQSFIEIKDEIRRRMG